ncbi:type II toxin-antitoxin system VapC family toxin [Sphingosinicella sp. BN140058]|uniref:type II toxin-antitoxin system VapC family toxin n=1 Tax=Sphingosinicella sp. BN140058 TaxID=1892855 RepID=UPI001010A3D2|nr:type II toxin-antitoxin system VapC family toxin [Sphingosinicella sp. BN140058]QAY78092.1 PIN domain-containing protein [Sphingosinicella sp. BN140058]
MSDLVLDASALLAMLQDERGGARVADAIAAARMSVVNHAEVVSHFIRLGMPPREVDAMLDPLPIFLVPADKGLSQMAGRLRAKTAEAGLSLGDRFCLALALRDGLPAWTADKAWRTIAEATGVEVMLIR